MTKELLEDFKKVVEEHKYSMNVYKRGLLKYGN